MKVEKFLNQTIDIENLSFQNGAHLLIKHHLQKISAGSELIITGFDKEWPPQLSAWCRSEGHTVSFKSTNDKASAHLRRGSANQDRWRDAQETGHSDLTREHAVHEIADPSWGLAARGAKVEAGTANFNFRLHAKSDIWSDNLTELYSQATAAQWNPNTALDWSTPKSHSEILEAAVVQIMTYLVENENVALLVPARFLGQIHPHFREVQALLALQIADEARHIEVFTRRIRIYGHEPALSTAGGQASLKTLLDEPDFSVSGFLLAVLGEGTFVNLLQFIAEYAPDPLTRQIAQLASRDESRHVAFGMSHLVQYLEKNPEHRQRLSAAVMHRHDNLAHTAGLNAEVFDALILLAAGELSPSAIKQGYQRVQSLLQEMAEGRCARLIRLGFSASEAEQLSNLHTRNFM